MRSVAILILLCFFNICAAQQMPVVAAMNRIILHKNDTLYEFYTAHPPTKFKLNIAETYSWYKDDTILVTQGGYGGKLLHGAYQSFYPNNNLYEQAGYRYGQKDGIDRIWDTSGHLRSVRKWKSGLLHGDFAEYDEGKIKTEGKYKKGYLDGTVTEYGTDGKATKTKYKGGRKIIPKPKTKAETPPNEDPKKP